MFTLDNKKNSKNVYHTLLLSFAMFISLFAAIANAKVSGSVVDTDDSSKVIVCHIPGDDPSKAFTLHISASAVTSHIDHHDDYDGYCKVPAELLCSPGYQLETWSDKLKTPGTNIFDSKKELLTLTASNIFTESTHPGIAGIRTSSANGVVSETLTLSILDLTVDDIESFRVLVYDLDSETVNDQDYAYINFAGANIAASSIGMNVENHPSITNAYRAILNSGGGSGADSAYHAGFELKGLSNGSIVTLNSGYSGTGSESFVGYQACVRTTTSKCFAMADDKAELYSFDLDISTVPTKVPTSMLMNGEGATYRATDNAIYTFNQPTKGIGDPSDLYKVEVDGTVTLVRADFITEQGVGAEFVNYEDGTERFVVLLREWDSRIQIYDATDLTNTVPLETIPLLFPDGSPARVDSLAINPNTGEILVADDSNDEFDYPEIYSVNLSTGQLTLKVTLSVPGIDAESLAFAEDGKLYLENEGWFTPAEYDHRIFNVNLDTGDLIAVEENINTLVTGDIEGMSCTGSKIITPLPKSNISGTIFKDTNSNDVFDIGEPVLANMTVWLQAINADGTTDPVKVEVVTDSLGNYQLPDLADGNYEVHVDTADTDLPANYSVGATNPLIININGSDVTDVDFPFDEFVCTPFTGEVNEAALPLSSQLNTSDKLFVPSKSVSPINGHLRAYAVDSYGVAASTETWDAGTRMNATNRSNNLYSSDSGGKLKLFNDLDDLAFLSSSLTVATIKAYTFDPSTDSGAYLAGRESGSFLGGISKGNELDILSDKINTSLYLYDKQYRDFYKNIASTRSKLVLMTSDDGFLYAFDYETGDLSWAWMPRSLVRDLVDYTNFQSKHLMAGTVDVLDLPDGGGKYHTYVVGSYKNGQGHYVLKLKDDATLEKVIWDDDQSSFFSKSPNNGEMEFFRDKDKTYAAYVLANEAPVSRLKIKSLIDTSVDMDVDLNYQASSTPFVMQDYGKNNAPESKTLYLGSVSGDIHATKLLATDGTLDTSLNVIRDGLQSNIVTNVGVTEPVLYIDSSVSARDSLYYLSTQTAKRLTLHRYFYNASGASAWKKAWTSYSSGAGSWDDSGSYTADSSGVPTDKGGFDIVPPSGIQSLPVDATLTAKAVIVGDSVVLPLSVLPASSSACYGKAYYYLYSLSDGKFPAHTFFNNDDTSISTNIALGYGEAKQLSITDMAGSNKLLGYGVADQKADGTSGIATSFVIKDPVTSGIRGWKEIGR